MEVSNDRSLIHVICRRWSTYWEPKLMKVGAMSWYFNVQEQDSNCDIKGVQMWYLETVPTFSIWRSFSIRTAMESGATESGRVFFNSLSNLVNSLWSCFTSVLSDTTTLTCALVVTSLAQLANKSVFLDCSTWLRAGLMVQMMAVLALPPKEDCNIRVSFESLKGICPFLPLLHQS